MSCLTNFWGNYFEDIQRFSANRLRNYGAYHLLNFIFAKVNKDYAVEIIDTEPGVNYAVALSANLASRNSFNNSVLDSLMANLYSGLPQNFIRSIQHHANTAIEDILGIGQEVPLIEMATTFRSGDVDRFRELVYCLTRHNKNQVELNIAICRFNREVSHYARHKERLNVLDIRSFLVDMATAMSAVNVPLAGEFIERALAALAILGAMNRSMRQI
jgi:hypothetical protein